VEKTVRNERGVTLIELIVVLSIVTILAFVSVNGIFDTILPENRLKSGLNQLYSDISFAQHEAIRQGNYNIMNGTLRERKVFVTFTPPNSYSIWRWEDVDGDNIVEAGEFDPRMAGGADGPVRTNTLGSATTISYGIPPQVGTAACDNGPLVAQPITYPQENVPPCGNCRNIEFDGYGFADASGVIYLTNSDNDHVYSISGNRAGIFTICKWDSNAGQWQLIPMH
jgi:prepilin-type N-terminal cleavage/methylation domain-containing protein